MPPIDLEVRAATVATALALFCLASFTPIRAAATPAVTIDVATGDVLYADDATQRWFPASTTKLMTVYLALSAVRDHKIALDTPLVVSARAHRMPPARMGFPVGTKVTLDNALKMLMVHSPNDIAITIAEGVAGSVEAFADDMNQAAARLGMHESHFVNPNGLPDPNHYVSARDMAILARAIYLQFPDAAPLFDIGELALGKERIQNTNTLLGRYPGMDGMKTGYTCEAGWNLVASAYRDGRRLVTIVFGGPTADLRNAKVVALMDRGFAGIDPPHGSILALPASPGGAPPDLHDQVCGKDGPQTAGFEAEIAALDAPLEASSAGTTASATGPEQALLAPPPNAAPGASAAARIAALPAPVFTPVPVRIGADPGYHGVVAQPRAAHAPLGTASTPIAEAARPGKRPGRRHAGTGRASEKPGKGSPRNAATSKGTKADAAL